MGLLDPPSVPSRFNRSGLASALPAASAGLTGVTYRYTDVGSAIYSGRVDQCDGTQWVTIVPPSGTYAPAAASTITANYTAKALDSKLVDASGGPVTISLPAPSQTASVFLRRVDLSTNSITVGATGGATIDGASSIELRYYREYVLLVSDGTNWFSGAVPRPGYAIVPDDVRTSARLDAFFAHVAGLGRFTHVVVPGGSQPWIISNSLVIPSGITRVSFEETWLQGAAGAYSGKTVGLTKVFATLAAVGLQRIKLDGGFVIDHQTNGCLANGLALMPTSVSTANPWQNGDMQGTPCSEIDVDGFEVLGYDSHQYNAWLVMCQRANVRNFRLDSGVSAATVGSQSEGVEIAGGTRVNVHDFDVQNAGSDAINLPDIIQNNAWNDVMVHHATVDGADNGICLRNGANIDNNADIVDVSFDHITVKNHRVRAVSFIYNAFAPININGVSFSHIYARSPNGASVEGFAGVGGTNVTANVSGVEFSHCRSDGATASADGDGAFFLSGVRNVRVVECIATNSSGNGFFGTSLTDCEIGRSWARGSRKCGFWVTASTRVALPEVNVHTYNIANGSYPAVKMDTTTDGYIAVGTVDKGSGTEATDVYVTSGCDRVKIAGMQYLGQSGVSPIWRNDGTNPSFATVTATAGSSFTYTNTQVRTNSRFTVRQVAGSPIAYTAEATGSSTITFTGTFTGSEQFKVELI